MLGNGEASQEASGAGSAPDVGVRRGGRGGVVWASDGRGRLRAARLVQRGQSGQVYTKDIQLVNHLITRYYSYIQP